MSILQCFGFSVLFLFHWSLWLLQCYLFRVFFHSKNIFFFLNNLFLCCNILGAISLCFSIKGAVWKYIWIYKQIYKQWDQIYFKLQKIAIFTDDLLRLQRSHNAIWVLEVAHNIAFLRSSQCGLNYVVILQHGYSNYVYFLFS